jgi:hypothetical protein
MGIKYDENEKSHAILITAVKSKDKMFKVNSLLEGYRHTMDRPPPYMRDHIPIQLAWAQINHYVR